MKHIPSTSGGKALQAIVCQLVTNVARWPAPTPVAVGWRSAGRDVAPGQTPFDGFHVKHPTASTAFQAPGAQLPLLELYHAGEEARNQQRAGSQPGRGVRGLAPRMPTPNHDHLIRLHYSLASPLQECSFARTWRPPLPSAALRDSFRCGAYLLPGHRIHGEAFLTHRRDADRP